MVLEEKPGKTVATCVHCGQENPSFFPVCARCRFPVQGGGQLLSFARGFVGCVTMAGGLLGGLVAIGILLQLIFSGANHLLLLGCLAVCVLLVAFFLYVGRFMMRLMSPALRAGDSGSSQGGDQRRAPAGEAAGQGAFRLSPQTTRGASLFIGIVALVSNCVTWPIAVAMYPFEHTPWYGLLLIGLFSLVSLGLLVFAVYVFLVKLRFKTGVMTVNQPSYVPGETVAFKYFQELKRSTHIDSCTVRLSCRESATYRHGSSTRCEWHDWPLGYAVIEVGGAMARDAISGDGRLDIPKSAMHSFFAAHNELQYFLSVEVSVPSWPKYRESFALAVLPSPAEARANHGET